VGTYAFFFAWNEYLYAVLLLQGESMITCRWAWGTS
jgi:ABC-type glycerol-3-phosphate transport system permease component